LAFGVGCIEALKCFEFVCDIILFQSGHKHSKIIFNLQMLLCRLCLWFGVCGLLFVVCLLFDYCLFGVWRLVLDVEML
jgi:hypothetical protein